MRQPARIIIWVSSYSLIVGCVTNSPSDEIRAKVAYCAETRISGYAEQLLRECKKLYGVADSVDIEIPTSRSVAPEQSVKETAAVEHEEINRLKERPLPVSREEATVRQLTNDEAERYWLRYMQRAFPKLKNDRRSLEMWLSTYREYSHRYEVNTIKMKHLYPNASEEELETLVQDATVTELQQKAKEEEREAERRNEVLMMPDYGLMFPPSLHCTSSRIGMFTNTDCY